MSNSEYVIARRANGEGKAVGEGHAVLTRATQKDGPYVAECGAKVSVVVGDWPPEDAEDHACPVCCRDTGNPWT
ncbi:MAG: hypothetical protein JWR62_3089 [Modestobacter sp.]|jgi:hypothetical protein|nr:hypothetical protein [Modestobacter sp.]